MFDGINNPSKAILSNFGVQLQKGKPAQEGEIREWNGQKFKKQGGKWIPVTESKNSTSSSDKSKDKSSTPNSLQSNIGKHEIGQLTHIKSLVENNPKKAYELYSQLTPEAQQVVPQDIVNKLVKNHHETGGDSGVDMTAFNSFQNMMYSDKLGFNDLMANGWFKSYDSSIQSLSKDQKTAIDQYRDTSYGRINMFERGLLEKTDDNKEEVKELQSISNNVSSAINSSEIKQDIVVYRGVDASKSEALSKFFESLEVGDTYTDKGFTSTTLNKDIGHSKFSSNKNKGANITILIPKGSNGLPMQNVGSESTKTMYNDEYEILLDKNSTFEVVEKDGSNITVILK